MHGDAKVRSISKFVPLVLKFKMSEGIDLAGRRKPKRRRESLVERRDNLGRLMFVMRRGKEFGKWDDEDSERRR